MKSVDFYHRGGVAGDSAANFDLPLETLVHRLIALVSLRPRHWLHGGGART
jgi:hypothetical protein